jgi:hypothetical protein
MNKYKTCACLTETKTCGHCGNTGTDVHMEKVYISGEGWVIQPRCYDEVACWERWEAREQYKKELTDRMLQIARPRGTW